MREFYAMFARLDAPHLRHERELRWWRALNTLRGRPELQRTLRAIRKNRVREKIISALKIKAETYEKRFRRVRETLKIRL